MNRTTKQIGAIFKEFGEKIENGTCGVDIETLNDIASKMLHIKMTPEELSVYINVSRPTIYRMVADNRLPKPHKDLGGNTYWYRDEVDDYIDSHK